MFRVSGCKIGSRVHRHKIINSGGTRNAIALAQETVWRYRAARPMENQRTERKLAAILAADVVGYSRLMSDDEEGTLARLKAHLGELVEPHIAAHRGRIVKRTGDGLLVDFASAVEAVRCAVAIQAGMAERNRAAPDDSRIEFRIGINLGDVIIEGDDIYGDGVNIAARLEAHRRAGRHLRVARGARFRCATSSGSCCEDLGEKPVKNIARPVRVFRIGAGERPARRAPLPGRAGQAVDRRAAVRQHERRRRAGLFQRRHHRGPDHRPVEGLRPCSSSPATPPSPTRAGR